MFSADCLPDKNFWSFFICGDIIKFDALFNALNVFFEEFGVKSVFLRVFGGFDFYEPLIEPLSLRRFYICMLELIAGRFVSIFADIRSS